MQGMNSKIILSKEDITLRLLAISDSKTYIFDCGSHSFLFTHSIIIMILISFTMHIFI